MSDLIRRAGGAIGAVDVSMWLIDDGQAFLTRSEDDSGDGGGSDGAIPVTGTAAGRVFARCEGLGCAETIRQLGHRVLEHADYELNDDATMLLVEWRGLPTVGPTTKGPNERCMSTGAVPLR